MLNLKGLKQLKSISRFYYLNSIIGKFIAFGWDLISIPAQQWLDGKADKDLSVSAIKQAGKKCGGRSCELAIVSKSF